MEEKSSNHFVLVHGACHGAWCWYKVATQLKCCGHKVTALDLAASGIHPGRIHEVHSVSDYLEPLIQFMMSLPPEDRVILVGHSMGGLAISVLMERFPEKISAGVFAAAFMPGPDLNFAMLGEEHARRVDSFLDTQYMFDNGPDNPPTSFLLGPQFLSTLLYQLSPPEDLVLAMSLVRPVPLLGKEVLENEAALTKEKYGSIPRVYIVCDQDKIIKEDLQRWMIQNNPTDEVKVISGSDHMVMFSKPLELCSCLEDVASKYF